MSFKTYDRSTGDNLDLDAGHVQLSTTGCVLVECGIGFVACNDLRSDQVLAIGQSSWDGEAVLSSVLDQGVNSPNSSGVTRLSKLDPDVSSTVGCGRSNIDHDWSLVGRIDDIVRSIVDVVIPLDGDLAILLTEYPS